MGDTILRVALLARAGQACERIGDALRDAGAELVLVADPVDHDPEAVRVAQPQAIVVALEPAIEGALERYDALFADPAFTVVFEEAELAAQRSGWDAARWLRHLAAKLHRHDNVLPPGAEPDIDWNPEPASPAPSMAADDPAIGMHFDLGEITEQAQRLADVVPNDAGVAGLAGLPDAAQAAASEPDAGFEGLDMAGFEGGSTALELVLSERIEAVPDAPGEGEDAHDVEDLSRYFDGEALSGLLVEEVTLEAAVDADPVNDADGSAGTFGDTGLTLLDMEADAGIPGGAAADADAAQASMLFDPVAFEAAELGALDDGAPSGVIAVDLSAFDPMLYEDVAEAPAEGAPMPGLDELLANVPDAVEPESGEPASTGPAQDAPGLDMTFGGLSLSLDESVAAPAAPMQASRPVFDLDSRIEGLSLADPDSYGHGPLRGAVLVDGGLGGPDAVRQLLAAIPQEFPRPVLVRLQLEGGRYDRLVRQMERVTDMPVLVAVAGGNAEGGSVYFLPPEIVPVREKGALVFAEKPGQAELLPDALPPEDSAVLLLSGASQALAQALAGPAWSAALVGGQSAEGCYDPDAAALVIARGGASGQPAELAARLVERWLPSSAAPASPPDEELLS